MTLKLRTNKKIALNLLYCVLYKLLCVSVERTKYYENFDKKADEFHKNMAKTLITIFVFAIIVYMGYSIYPNVRNKIKELVSSEQKQQVPLIMSFLSRESTGEEVKLLQKILASDREIYPEGYITGYYGEMTEQAVRRFQNKYNLQETGQVDEVTKNKFNEIYFTKLPDKQISKTEEEQDDFISSRNNCKKDNTLEKARYCTTLVLRNDGGYGTGFSIQPGYIITNKHVIEGTNSIKVLIGKEEVSVNLWNYHDSYDVAVLKLPDNKNLSTCNWFNSNNLKIAEEVYAFGWPNVPNGSATVTKGIYSRSVDFLEGYQYIQHDAAINKGNSGGPLINECGIIGINTWKRTWTDENTPSEGMGFALSSNSVYQIIKELISKGSSDKQIPQTSSNQITYKDKPNEQNQYADLQTIKSYLISTYQIKSLLESKKEQFNQEKINKILDIFNRQIDFCKHLISKLESGQKLNQDDIFMWNSVLSMENEASQIIQQLLDEYQEKNKPKAYEPIKYHYTCKNMMCTYVQGDGPNDCTFSSDCYYYTCDNMVCKKVEGKGTNDCLIDYDCKHSECKDGKCVEVAGKGTNGCYSDYSCKHSECQNGKCVEVNSPGTNTCYSDYSCQ